MKQLVLAMAILLGFAAFTDPVTAADTPVTISTEEGLKIKGENWEWKILGRLVVDAAIYESDGNPGFESGTKLRRARLGISGKAYEHWAFKLQYDFSSSSSGLDKTVKDAFLSYSGLDPLTITLGHFDEPFSLEALSSSKHVTFIERSLVANAFPPGRNIGLQGHAYLADHFTITLGVFDDEDQKGDWNVTGRFSYSPVHEKTRAVHLGTSFSYRNLGGSSASYQLKSGPATRVSSSSLVDTGELEKIDTVLLNNLEAAGVWGPLAAQAEYFFASPDEKAGQADVGSYKGWYAEVSWILTGESRNYSWEDGTFGSVRPRRPVFEGGMGAWQAGLRYAKLDLDTVGGELDELTLGLTWYASKNLRFLAEYLRVLDHQPRAGEESSYEPGVFQARVQFYF